MAKMGRPTSYKPEYCEELIRHMERGNSFESFGSTANCGRASLYRWLETHDDFRDAKNKGETRNQKFLEDMGMMLATGQLKRLISEEPIMTVDKDGKPTPAIDPNSGQVLYKRVYAPTQGNAASWIFMMKNMHNWRDHKNVIVSGDEGGGPVKITAVQSTPQDDLREIIEVQNILKELEEANASVADIKIKD